MPSTIVLALDTVVFTIEMTPFDPDEIPVLSDVMRPEPAVVKLPRLTLIIFRALFIIVVNEADTDVLFEEMANPIADIILVIADTALTFADEIAVINPSAAC